MMFPTGVRGTRMQQRLRRKKQRLRRKIERKSTSMTIVPMPADTKPLTDAERERLGAEFDRMVKESGYFAHLKERPNGLE